ncbi:toxin-antitoxin system YwqK family antitoxin [Fusobacterium canifelinum]|uniref:toxin-antitoxin system YwqK family antitoxin n=1 Tax=Fusobacterium canifelinum TaxID=285729 RepID=UPI0030D390E8
MKKILLFLLLFCSFITYSANGLDYDELDKYISEKLDRDKEMTLTYKINKINNTLESISDEGKVCEVVPLNEKSEVLPAAGTKVKISEKKGNLNPVIEMYIPGGALAQRIVYNLNSSIKYTDKSLITMYLEGEIPYNDIKLIMDKIDYIQIEIYKVGKIVSFRRYTINHKTEQIIFREGTNAETIINKSVLSLNGLNGISESYYDNGKLYLKADIKNNKLNGKVEKFSENSGKLIGKGTIKNGLLDGEFVEYDEAGKVISKAKYKDGKEIK